MINNTELIGVAFVANDKATEPERIVVEELSKFCKKKIVEALENGKLKRFHPFLDQICILYGDITSLEEYIISFSENIKVTVGFFSELRDKNKPKHLDFESKGLRINRDLIITDKTDKTYKTDIFSQIFNSLFIKGDLWKSSTVLPSPLPNNTNSEQTVFEKQRVTG